MEGSAEERQCPIWKVALITVYDRFEDPGNSFDDITLIGHGPHYESVPKSYTEADKEACYEMVHIWKSVDRSCFVSFVSIESIQEERAFHNRFRHRKHLKYLPALPEMRLPESATLHKFGFQSLVHIEWKLWEAWDQVLEEYYKSMPGPAQHKEAILRCATRLLEAPCPDIGMCWTARIFLGALPKADKRRVSICCSSVLRFIFCEISSRR